MRAFLVTPQPRYRPTALDWVARMKRRALLDNRLLDSDDGNTWIEDMIATANQDHWSDAVITDKLNARVL